MTLVVALVDRIYRTLILLYPASFRTQHGGEMALDFADAARDAHRTEGWRGLSAHWARSLADLIVTIVQQWLATFWPTIGLLSMAVTVLGFSAALRFVPDGPFAFRVDPLQEELAILLLLLLGALIPIFGVVVFCGCFLRPHLYGRRGRRRV